MDDAQVNQVFTRIHATTKSGEAQIGSKGVGFLSVFSFEPDAVFVDTGGVGDSGLRLHFKPDRTFDRMVLDSPPKGMDVLVIKDSTQDVTRAW